ncbi:hypothetical protein [Flavobacterium sp. IMCC34518]|uniref:hypothetical protein n=1 Tax=Flavobacterium sp. IMCC34518 TaxID=3003623 RepID=UPI002482A479|nr:hypothetical protein [Flavobacterium sp. IMCC34518]
MKKIIGIILGLLIILITYNFVSHFISQPRIKHRTFGETSENIKTSKQSGFYIGNYITSFDTIRLKNYNEKIIITNVWVEKSWFTNTYDYPSPKLEKTDGYNIVLEFNTTNKDFIFDLMPVTNDRFGKDSYGIFENKKEMRFEKLPSKLKIIVEERNPDKSIGWEKKVTTDTIVLNLKKNEL